MHHALMLTVLARGSIHCNAACGRALAQLFRLIYHIFGWTGVVKIFGGGIAAFGCYRFGVLLKTPLEPFTGRIDYDAENRRFVVDQYPLGSATGRLTSSSSRR